MPDYVDSRSNGALWASLTLGCGCGEECRFIARGTVDGEIRVTTAYYACDCEDRPAEQEAEQEAERMFSDHTVAVRWGALYQKSEAV